MKAASTISSMGKRRSGAVAKGWSCLQSLHHSMG